MGQCASKLQSDNSNTNAPLSSTAAFLSNPLTTGDNDTSDTLNGENSDIDATNSDPNAIDEKSLSDVAVLLTKEERILVLNGYAHLHCDSHIVPFDIIEQLADIYLDDAFYWKIKYEQLYKLRNDSLDSISFTSSVFIFRRIRFQLQLTKIIKDNSDHGFQLSARLLSKNVILTTTIALQCIETQCGYHNFVENFFESGWPSSTLKLSDLSDDITELNFICRFDILRIQPMLALDIEHKTLNNNLPLHRLHNNNNNRKAIEAYYKPITMKQKVQIVWSLNDKISPSYRTDNDDTSLILFYESPQFERDQYVIHFIQSNVLERDGFAVMLELFSYPKGVSKLTLKWIVIVSYDGKIVKKRSVDDFSLSDSCHSKAFSKSDYFFIGETNVFSLALLTICVEIEVLEIYDEYDQRIPWKNIRHWPNYGVVHSQFWNQKRNDFNRNCAMPMDHKYVSPKEAVHNLNCKGMDESEMNLMSNNIINLENKMKKMDEKLTKLLSIKCEKNSEQNGHNIHCAEKLMSNDRDFMEFKQWLSDEVHLPNYCELLTKNGFNSLQMIQEINSVNELNYIGIHLKAHQLKFMNHINKLKQNDNDVSM